MNILLPVAASFAATVFFAMLLGQPRRTLLLSAAIAALGYLIFLLMGQTTVAYFISTLIISLLSEVCARVRKMAATLFFTSAIIPLVPGLGLYRTMRYIAAHEYDMAASVGADTILGICAIALAITAATLVFANIPHKKHPGSARP